MTLRVSPAEIVARSSDPLLGIHESWSRIELGQVAEILNGFAFKSPHFNRDGIGLPLIRIRDVGKPKTDTYYSGEYESRYIVPPGSVLIGMDGDFRVAQWSGSPALLNQRVCRVTIREGAPYHDRFLLYVLPGYLKAVHEATSSITVKHLSSRTIETLPLPFPPLPQQRRIVEAIEEQFSRLAAAEDSLRRARTKVEVYGSAILEAIASGGVDWPARVLGDVATWGSGGTPKATNRAFYGGGIPWAVIGDLNEAVVYETQSTLTEEGLKGSSAKLIEQGTVMVAMYGSIGRVGVAGVKMATNQAIAWAVPHSEALERDYLLWFLRSQRNRFRAAARGTTQGNISQTILKGWPIRVPPLDLQRSFVKEMERHHSLMQEMQREISNALSRAGVLRRATLRTAFAGRLVPHEVADEPASNLLEEVKG